jgi:hypothetical protein
MLLERKRDWRPISNGFISNLKMSWIIQKFQKVKIYRPTAMRNWNNGGFVCNIVNGPKIIEMGIKTSESLVWIDHASGDCVLSRCFPRKCPGKCTILVKKCTWNFERPSISCYCPIIVNHTSVWSRTIFFLWEMTHKYQENVLLIFINSLKTGFKKFWGKLN